MQVSCIALKQSFKDVGFLAVDVYTTGNRDGLRRAVLLLLTCSLFSLLLSSLLLLFLLYTLDYETAVAGGIAGCFGTLLTVALFLSKQVRCTGILFLISIFMKKSRHLLLTAGTSLVVLRNIHNTSENLAGLVRSMICNMKAKTAFIVTPLNNYVNMLKWVGHILRGVTDLGVVRLDPQLKVSFKVESGRFRDKLVDAEQQLNETAKYAQAVVNTLLSVTDRLFPAISLLLLMTLIALHIKKYCNNMKFKNTFINSQFIRFDEMQKAEGKPHVLPLTPEEEKLYRSIQSTCPTAREGKAMLKFGIPVFSHFIVWVIFISVDALLYCFVDIVTTQLSELEPFNVPLTMNITGIQTVLGIQIREEDHHKDFTYSVTLFEKKCLPKPELLLYITVAPLAAILTALFIMAMMAAKLTQLRLLVCERFFSTSAEERAEYLHAKILRKRSKRKNEKANDCSLTSLIFQPNFWCPLLFRQKEDAQNVE